MHSRERFRTPADDRSNDPLNSGYSSPRRLPTQPPRRRSQGQLTSSIHIVAMSRSICWTMVLRFDAADLIRCIRSHVGNGRVRGAVSRYWSELARDLFLCAGGANSKDPRGLLKLNPTRALRAFPESDQGDARRPAIRCASTRTRSRPACARY
jgi:hypothetical protein